MIRIKTTGRAMPNTTQWTEHSGRNVINHTHTQFGTCRQEVLMPGWWHYECCGVLSLAEEVERFFYILVGGCLVDENGPDIT